MAGAETGRTGSEAAGANAGANAGAIARVKPLLSLDGLKRALFDLDVRFISLVPAPANRRLFVAKGEKEEGLAEGLVMVEKVIEIKKQDAAKRIVYGIVYVPGQVDADGDAMTAEEIEKAAYGFMQRRRTGQVDTDHSQEAGAGFVAESWIVKDEGDALFDEEPVGSWAVGIKVTDGEVWKRVEEGELKGLSLYGFSRGVVLEEADGVAEQTEETAVEKQDAGRGGRGDAETGGVLEAIKSLMRGAGLWPVAKGASFRRLVGGLVDDLATEERPRSTIIAEMAAAAGVTEGTIGALLDADHPVAKPFTNRQKFATPADSRAAMAALAGVLGTKAERLIEAAVRDGATAEMYGAALTVETGVPTDTGGEPNPDDEDVTVGDGYQFKTAKGNHRRGEAEAMKKQQDGEKTAAEEQGTQAAQRAGGGDEGVSDEVEKGASPLRLVMKSFREKLVQEQMWNVTRALGEAIREVLDDDEKTLEERLMGVEGEMQDFMEWLWQVHGVQRVEAARPCGGGGGGNSGGGDPPEIIIEGSVAKAVGGLMGPLREELAVVKALVGAVAKADEVAGILARVEALEGQTNGRQTVLGGEDVEVKKSNGEAKGHKGLTIKL